MKIDTRKLKRVKLYPNQDGFTARLQDLFKTVAELAEYTKTEAGKWALEVAGRVRDVEVAWSTNDYVEFSTRDDAVHDLAYAQTYLMHNDRRVDILNPGDNFFQHLWLISVQMGFEAAMFVVDSSTCSDALDEFADSKYGHLIEIENHERKDYKGRDIAVGDRLKDDTIATEAGVTDLNDDLVTDVDAIRFLQEPNYLGNAGTPCDLDHTRIVELPNTLRIYGPRLPEGGITAREYSSYTDNSENVTELYELLTRKSVDVLDKLEAIVDAFEDIRARQNDRIDARNKTLYGSYPYDVCAMLCRIVFPGSRNTILPDVTDDLLFKRARETIINAQALHEGAMEVTSEDVVVDGKPAKAVLFGKWNRDTMQTDTFVTMSNHDVIENITTDFLIARRGWVTEWQRVDGDGVYRLIITDTKPV